MIESVTMENMEASTNVLQVEEMATGSNDDPKNAAGRGDLKKVFVNAVRKNNVIQKIQALQEEKDVVPDTNLSRTSTSVQAFREKFQRSSRPNSLCMDPCDMVPADPMSGDMAEEDDDMMVEPTVKITVQKTDSNEMAKD